MILITSCQPVKGGLFFGPTATPTQTPTPTVTPTPLPTATPTPTPTPVPAARVETGEAALTEGDWDRALEEFNTAFQASDNTLVKTAALMGVGRVQFFSHQPAQAVDTFTRLINDYPGSAYQAQAFFYLGQSYSDLERYSDAADAYLNYLALRPGVIDGYVLDLRGDALFAVGDYAGAANDFKAAMASPSVNDPIYLQMKLARATSLSGDGVTALALYDDVYARTSDDRTKALVDLRKGQIYTDQGELDQAYAAYLDAVDNYPTAYESYSCLLALVDAGIPVDELNRGLVDYFAGQYGVALAAFDRYLQQDSAADPGTALYYTGMSQLNLGGYQGAIAAWDKLIQGYPDHRDWDDAWEQKAYTQWYYLDQYSQGIQTLLGFVAAAPTHARAGEFLFDAAQVAERMDDLQQAAELWHRMADQYPLDPQAQRAMLLAGLSEFRLKDYPAAQASFQQMLAISSSLGDKAAADFWLGKVQAAQGDEAGASATWTAAAAIDPTGYYSERALDLVKGRDLFTPPKVYDLAVDLRAERTEAEAWLRKTFNLPEDTDLSGPGALSQDGYLQRGQELWNLGLFEDARSEFEQLRRNVQDDPVQTYRLANYLNTLGLYRSAAMAARQVLTLAGMSDADTLQAPIYFNHLRFGIHYSDLILPLAQEYNFNPLFLFSLIRQESLFESFVSSSAAARGLMQIIPATGADIARNLGWPDGYTDADLYRPVVNLKFGVDYLETQRNAFKGDLFAMLAAYNGGPGNALAWQKLAGGDPDVFVEVVRYSETRTYIRSIYEIFSLYRRIYDRTP